MNIKARAMLGRKFGGEDIMGRYARLALCVLVCLGLASLAFAQAYPARAIRIICPLPSGTSTDLLARMLAPKMSAGMGQAVIVENRTGASGVIGAEAVARAAPDGYTIMFGSPSEMVTAPLLSKSIPFDPVKDFTPISLSIEPVTVLLARPTLPVNSIAELIDYAKRNPGKLSYGSAGTGSVFHVMGEAINSAAGIDMVHLPYKGVTPAMNDVMANQIDLTFGTVASTRGFVSAGKMKWLAVLEPARYPGLPNLPSVSETLPTFEKPPTWSSFFGPAGLPQPVLARLHGEISKALVAPDVHKWLDSSGLALVNSTPEQLGAKLKNDLEVFARLIKIAGLKPE
jgi:tripartite-type tricarboxylate transporter receptor subunit TctC